MYLSQAVPLEVCRNCVQNLCRCSQRSWGWKRHDGLLPAFRVVVKVVKPTGYSNLLNAVLEHFTNRIRSIAYCILCQPSCQALQAKWNGGTFPTVHAKLKALPAGPQNVKNEKPMVYPIMSTITFNRYDLGLGCTRATEQAFAECSHWIGPVGPPIQVFEAEGACGRECYGIFLGN